MRVFIMNLLLMLKKYLLPFILCILILAVNAFRFINLENVPAGFHIDEQVAGVVLACLAQDGSAPLGSGHYPLFGENSFATPSPPTYMYPGMLWVKAFGFSQTSMRALTGFSFIIALLGLFAIGCRWAGLRCGLWVLLAGSVSPWTWILSRIAWESLFILPFLIWAIFFCFNGKKLLHFLTAGFLFSCAAYAYPTGRMQIPLLLVLLTWYGISQLKWRLPHITTLGGTFLLTSVPLVLMYLSNPALAARFKDIAITNPAFLKSINSSGSLPELFSIVIENFMMHLTPTFLFFKGNPANLTLTTGLQGIMGWLDVIAIILGITWMLYALKNKQSIATERTWTLLIFLIGAIIIGVLPATLTFTDNPHALRTIGAWPFAMLATGFILHRSTEKWEWLAWPLLAAAVIFMTVYLKQYFNDYAKVSQGWFSYWSLAEARNAKTDNDWMNFMYRYHPHMFTSRYYLMRYHGDSCAEARERWHQHYPFFRKFAERNKKNP